MSLLHYAPQFSPNDVPLICKNHYGIAVHSVAILPSERDQNFRLTTADQGSFVLKISGGAEDRDFVEGQNLLFESLSKQLDFCPRIVKNIQGEQSSQIRAGELTHVLRLFEYVEGMQLASLNYHPPALVNDVGKKIGLFNRAVCDFDHPAFHRDFQWDLVNAIDVVNSKIGLVTDPVQRSLIENFVQQYLQHAEPRQNELPKSIIHNDANDGNLIVGLGESSLVHDRLVGLIDFGDAVYSWTVADIAVAIAYAVLDQPEPLKIAAHMLRGYTEVNSLNENEIECLFGLICMRLCLSVVMAAEQQKIRPNDPYLVISQEPIRNTMPRLAAIPYSLATSFLKHASGIPLSNSSKRVVEWLKNNKPFPLAKGIATETSHTIDLSVGSRLLAKCPPDSVEQEVGKIVRRELLSQNKIFGITRYLEARIDLEERHDAVAAIELNSRNIQLAVDLFAVGKAQLHSTYDGVIVDIQRSAETSITLQHDIDSELTFFCRYHRVDADSIEHLKVGDAVKRGEVFGRMEFSNEHDLSQIRLQLILDRFGPELDFPAAVEPGSASFWSEYSLDPNWITGSSIKPCQNPETAINAIANQRRSMVGANLSLAYDHPLAMSRGWKQFLFDRCGRRYLDAYNNVPHVGHCHPEVVAVAEEQMSLLNTNTRYLGEQLNEYASAVVATFPKQLEVCYFLNSASEANELAMRLARCHTGARDMIVLSDAYHGNTTSLIDISPYKHDGPGGHGRPAWVHIAPIADMYRGEFKNPENAGIKFAGKIQELTDRIAMQKGQVAAFIAESCPSVGGQIIFPDNYLKSVYEIIRESGGVCIADEVQTGFGRLGHAFYGFELQNVIPDIVVLGKPIGNGHPIAALVTTREIADSFNNGMEFFSTFGGNNVSCAIGKKVLEIVQRDQLQRHAREVGDFLLGEFRKLKKQYPLIGDVRGLGLFLGLELVRNHKSLEPAAHEAKLIVNRMRERGILIGTDGPYHNVLKVRPPMPFDFENATSLVNCLNLSFAELYEAIGI